jgi:hypothetical protein
MLCLSGFSIASYAQPIANHGILDARDFDFSSGRLNLTGTWIMYDNQLFDPHQIKGNTGVQTTFPELWNERRDSGLGAATYQLTVLVTGGKDFAVDIPQLYSSYRLWVNGQLTAENGVPGMTAEETVPQWLPKTVVITAGGDTLDFVLQIANFSHHKGGCKDPIYLGDSSSLMSQATLSMISKFAECAMLFILGAVFLIIYIMREFKKVVIYFSLLCFTWSVRSLFSNDYGFIYLFPDFSWDLMVRIEYITLYLTMMWAILYLVRVFRNEASDLVKYLLVTLNGAFLAYTVFATPIEFTMLLPVYLVTSGIVLLYGAGIVLLALINERAGATFLTISVVLGLIIFSYDIFTYEGLFSYNSLLFSAGYVVIFVLMGLALLIKLEIIKSTKKRITMLTYKDLYGDQK